MDRDRNILLLVSIIIVIVSITLCYIKLDGGISYDNYKNYDK